MSLRKINSEDLDLLYNWRNHPATRNYSFEKKEISKDNHKSWFKNVLNGVSIATFIYEVNNEPVGVIRFDFEKSDKEVAKINYLIDQSKFGKGYGTKILQLGLKKVFRENLYLRKVYGYVLKENIASIKIFEKLEFKKTFEGGKEIKYEKLRS